MYSFKYSLERYAGNRTLHRCPQCEHQGTFVRYIDNQTGEYLNTDVGKCNRLIKCAYHYTPKQYFTANGLGFQASTLSVRKPETIKPSTYIPHDILIASMANYEANNFTSFLEQHFGSAVTTKLISRYMLGTSKRWDSATVFWYVDKSSNVHYGKVMVYNTTKENRNLIGIDCKRDKHKFDHCGNIITRSLTTQRKELPKWLIGYQGQIGCFFGEHLLKSDPSSSVAIVESEKAAIIASVHFPQYVWLASGGLQNLNLHRMKALKGRTVVLFPDLKAFDIWRAKALQMSHITTIVVSDYLENNASESDKVNGLDLADYLLRYDHNSYALKHL